MATHELSTEPGRLFRAAQTMWVSPDPSPGVTALTSVAFVECKSQGLQVFTAVKFADPNVNVHFLLSVPSRGDWIAEFAPVQQICEDLDLQLNPKAECRSQTRDDIHFVIRFS